MIFVNEASGKLAYHPEAGEVIELSTSAFVFAVPLK